MRMLRSEREKLLKLEFAFALFRRSFSQWSRRRIAGVSKREFLDELGKRKIQRHYTSEEFEEDLSFAKGGL